MTSQHRPPRTCAPGAADFTDREEKARDQVSPQHGNPPGPGRLGGRLLAVSGVAASAGTASAGTTLTIRYPVKGSTHLKTPDADLALGPGKLTATADLNTDAITAHLSLPNATGSFKELGLVPVTATTKFINDGPTTGTVDPDTGAVTTRSKLTLRIVDLEVAGIDQPVGDSCQTSTPVTVKVSSRPGFSILKGGNLAGSYTIPSFANCGLETTLINLTVPDQATRSRLPSARARWSAEFR